MTRGGWETNNTMNTITFTERYGQSDDIEAEWTIPLERIQGVSISHAAYNSSIHVEGVRHPLMVRRDVATEIRDALRAWHGSEDPKPPSIDYGSQAIELLRNIDNSGPISGLDPTRGAISMFLSKMDLAHAHRERTSRKS